MLFLRHVVMFDLRGRQPDGKTRLLALARFLL